MEKRDIRSMLPAELEADLAELGERPFRAKQIFKWVQQRGVTSFDEMTDISLSLRTELDRRYYLQVPKLLEKQQSADGTIKFLWAMADGQTVETVVMRYRYGNTICISTQVGCRMGCVFCASTVGGLVRNLEASELLGQVLFSAREAELTISNIVLMGIGEPLDNFEGVLRFLELVNHPDGQNIGMRHITISTCGLTEIIDKLAEYTLQLTLSISLHAPDDETRDRLMPQNRGQGIAKLMAACKRYTQRTGRRLSFEYTLIDGVNDSPEQARLLADWMADVGGHVNLILLNPARGGGDLRPSSKKTLDAFSEILKRRGVGVTVRRQLGTDIDASCGQLRRRQGVQREGM